MAKKKGKNFNDELSIYSKSPKKEVDINNLAPLSNESGIENKPIIQQSGSGKGCRIDEDRVSIVLKKDVINKMKWMAKKEGVTLKLVYTSAVLKEIEAYEKIHGEIKPTTISKNKNDFFKG